MSTYSTLAAGDVDAQVVAGDGFDRVGFVEDHDVVVGQDAHAGPPQRDVAEQQRVVDDQNLRVLHRGGGPCSRSTWLYVGQRRPMQLPLSLATSSHTWPSGWNARSLSEPSCVALLHLRIVAELRRAARRR